MMKSIFNVGLVALTVSLGSLAGCGSSSSSAPSSKEIKAAAGGTIVADGVTAVIPPGALAADTTITVQVSYGSGEPNADSIVAKVYDFGPNGTQFTQPVTLTMDLDAAKLPAGKTATMAFLEGGSWVALGDSVTAGTKVTATTTHFTKFTVVSGGAECNTLTNSAPVIAETRVAQTLPTGTGGLIADGTYHKTGKAIFTGPTGASGPTGSTEKNTIVISNAASGTATVQVAAAGDGAADSHGNFALTGLTPTGNSFVITQTCPAGNPASATWTYTASSTQLLLYDPGNNRLDTSTKQ